MPNIENAGIDSNIFWVQKDTSGDTLVISNGQMKFNIIYTSGNSNKQVNQFFNLITGVSSGGSITLDLFDLTTTFFGEPFNFSLNGGKIKILCVENLSTGNSNQAVVDFAGTNRFKQPFGGSDTLIDLYAESNFLISNKVGWTVNSSNRYIDISDAGGLGPSVEISILGST